MPTIRDVADRAGVSRATVSRVLAGRPTVDPALKARVEAAVRELDFRPDPVASALARRRSAVVTLIVADVQNPFYAALARGVQDVCHEHGLTLLLANSDDRPEIEQTYLRRASEYRAAGVLLSPASGAEELQPVFRELTCPVVLVNRYLRGVETDAVVLDNLLGGYLATRHLLELGHREIAHLAGPGFSSASRDRAEGYRQALQEWGITPDPGWTFPGTLYAECGRRWARQFAAGQPSFTAVFAVNDLVAIGVMESLATAGVAIPGDVSLVGFDNSPLSALWCIGLTTLEQPGYEMGRAAAQCLLERIKAVDKPTRRILLEPKLMIRNTTAPARRRG